MHDHRSGNVPIKIGAAITMMPTLGERLSGDLATLRALSGGSSRINTDKLGTGTCSLVLSSIAVNCAHEASATCLASIPRAKPLMFRSSNPIRPNRAILMPRRRYASIRCWSPADGLCLVWLDPVFL